MNNLLDEKGFELETDIRIENFIAAARLGHFEQPYYILFCSALLTTAKIIWVRDMHEDGKKNNRDLERMRSLTAVGYWEYKKFGSGL